MTTSTHALPTSQLKPQSRTTASNRQTAHPSQFFRAPCDGLTILEPQPQASGINAEFFLGRLHAASHTSNVFVKRSSLSNRASTSDDSIREIAVAAHVADHGGHPHIVKGLGAYLDNDAAHLVMEHCTNGDLLQRLKSYADGKMTEREALDVLLQVARGLQFLHQCNIAHRDISIENVLVTANNVYKLCDFGLSTEVDVVSSAREGKAHYMAPEVFTSTPHDPATADIWSLGALFFILLTGSPMVKLASARAEDFRAFLKMGSRGVLKLGGADRGYSMATLDLLDGMLRANPRERFGTVASILEHPAMLAAAARHLGLPPQTVVLVPSRSAL